MISLGSFKDLDREKYDENWMIVRQPDVLPDFAKNEPLLSPSPELFAKYMELYNVGKHGPDFFYNVYVPQFVEELSKNEPALAVMDQLVKESKEKDFILCCYCEIEETCHRSIIGGILSGMGAEIDTDPEYLKYYKMFTECCE